MVRAAWGHMRGHHAQLTSVTQIADALGVNYHTLRDRFRRETSFTLEDGLCLVRVRQALRLMADPALVLKEIAWETGFAGEDALTRAVKKWLGLPPQIVKRKMLRDAMVRLGLRGARNLLAGDELLKN